MSESEDRPQMAAVPMRARPELAPLRDVVDRLRAETRKPLDRADEIRASGLTVVEDRSHDGVLLSITVGFEGPAGEPLEMAVEISPEVWSALTEMWEHNAEQGAYMSAARDLEVTLNRIESGS